MGVLRAVCAKHMREPQPRAETARRACVRVSVCIWEGWGRVLMCFQRLVEQFITMAQLDPLICSWEQLFGREAMVVLSVMLMVISPG